MGLVAEAINHVKACSTWDCGECAAYGSEVLAPVADLITGQQITFEGVRYDLIPSGDLEEIDERGRL